MDSTQSNVSSNSGSIVESLQAIATSVLSAFSIDKLVDFGNEITNLAEIQYESEVKMETVAKNVLGMTDEEIQGWKDLASQYQKTTTFGDEATLSVMALTSGILQNADSVETLLPSIQDMTSYLKGAGATTQQYEQVAKDMARAIEDDSLPKLEKLGIYLSDEYAAAWDEATSAEERAQIVSDYVQETYGEMAETMAETATGSLVQVNNSWGDFKETLGDALAPVLQIVADLLLQVTTFLNEHSDIIAPLVLIVAGLAGAFVLVQGAIAAYNVIMGIMAVVNTAAFLPILLVVAGIAALIAIIVLCIKHWDEIKAKVIEVWESIVSSVQEAVGKVTEKFNSMKQKITDKVTDIKDKVKGKFEEIKQTISDKVNEAKDTVSGVFEDIKGKIQEKIENAKSIVGDAIEGIKEFFDFDWSLPPLKLPTFEIKGQFSLHPISVPTISVSWNAKGGVFDSPTLFAYGNGRLGGLGEDGAEAVVPLEKNTKWLDVIAEKLGARQSSTPIVLQVDGKTFAQTSIDCINALTRQQGSLGLKLI